MKHILLAFGMSALAIFQTHAAVVDLTGNLSTRTLTTENCYYLKGCVVVPNGVVLTIDPGVEIRCESGASLTVAQGGQLFSNGSSSLPVVFTSDKAVNMRAPGDWVGIAINGYAKNNVLSGGGGTKAIARCSSFTGGGMNDNDNSGVLKFTRIEFAGGASGGYTFTDALVLNAVGDATEIHDVQISQSAGNGIYLSGGKVDLKNIYTLDAHKSGLFLEDGYTGQMQTLLEQRKSLSAQHSSGAYGIRIENNLSANNNTPLTRPIISNATFMGPVFCGAANPISTNFKSGIFIDRNGGVDIYNTLVAGYREYGLFINDAASAQRTANGTLNLSYSSFTNNLLGDYAHGVFTWSSFGCSGNMGDWITGATSIGCEEQGNEFNTFNPNYNSSLCADYCGDNFTPNFIVNTPVPAELLDPDYSTMPGFFDVMTYRGGLQTSSVFNGWIAACPQKEDYCSLALLRSQVDLPQLMFAPNPANTFTQMQFEAQHTGQASLTILDKVSGNVVLSKTVSINHIGKQDIRLSLTGLRENVYTVRVLMKDKVLHGQLVIK